MGESIQWKSVSVGVRRHRRGLRGLGGWRFQSKKTEGGFQKVVRLEWMVTLGKAQGQWDRNREEMDGWKRCGGGGAGVGKYSAHAQSARLWRAQRCPQRPIQYTVKEEPLAAVGPPAPKGVCAPVLS